MRQIMTVALAVILTGCAVSAAHITPLAAAARRGDAAAIHDLVSRGADPNEPAGSNGWTPVMHAIHKHQNEAVTALIDAGADVNRATVAGQTALMMAAGYGYADVVQILLRRGADARIKDANGESAIDWALAGMNDIDRMTIFNCQDATVRMLAAAGARAKPGASLRWAKIKRCESVALLR
jgi:uncharacterized protein